MLHFLLTKQLSVIRWKIPDDRLPLFEITFPETSLLEVLETHDQRPTHILDNGLLLFFFLKPLPLYVPVIQPRTKDHCCTTSQRKLYCYYLMMKHDLDAFACHIHLPVCLWIIDSHSRAPKKNTSPGNEVLPQDTTHPMQRWCYQRGSPCKDPAGNRTTRRPPNHSKEKQTAVVWSCLPFIRSGQNHLARHSERGKKTRQTEEKVGRQHQGKDRPGVL